jgi:membrane-associated phospholipid phosphatase
VSAPHRRAGLASASRAAGLLVHGLRQCDAGVLTCLQQFRSPRVDLAARIISWFGLEAVWALLALWLVRLGRTQRWAAVLQLGVVWAGAELLNSGLKQLIRRPRPQRVDTSMLGQAFSFPSGHAMGAAAFYYFLAHHSWQTMCGRQRVVCATGSLLLSGLVGLARLHLGVHYFSDVLAGYVSGLLWTVGVIRGTDLLGRQRRGTARRHLRRGWRRARRTGLTL